MAPRGTGAPPDRDRPRYGDHWKGMGSYGTLGLEIVLSIALGFFGGRWIDGKLGTEPWLSILGFIFGVGAAVKAVMRAMGQMAAETAREEREQGNPLPAYDKPDDRDDDDRREPAAGDRSSPDAPTTNGVSRGGSGRGEA
jgi:ATP synthase protein I